MFKPEACGLRPACQLVQEAAQDAGASAGAVRIDIFDILFSYMPNGNRNYFSLYHKDLKCRLTLTSLNTVVPANTAQLQLTQRDTN